MKSQYFFKSEVQKAIKLKNKHKQNNNERKKYQNKNDPINLGYSNGETEDRFILKESPKMP